MCARGGTRVVLMDVLFINFLLCLFSQTWAIPMVSKHVTTLNAEDNALYQVNLLARSALDLTLNSLKNRSLSHDRGSCTLETLRVRRDWRALTERERRAYIDSILCLQRLPPQTPAALAAGAKTRYDDFLATHINQTWHIHRTVCPICSECLKGVILIKSRAPFWRGIGTSSSRLKRPFVMNVVTAVISRKSYTFQSLNIFN